MPIINITIKELRGLDYDVEFDYNSRKFRWVNKDVSEHPEYKPMQDQPYSDTPLEAWQDAANYQLTDLYFNRPFFPSADHAWKRIAFFIAAYGGDFDRNIFDRLMQEKHCIDELDELQKDGVQFSWQDCRHWAFELCGTFEVTHRSYYAPVGSQLPAAKSLYETVQRVISTPINESLDPEQEESQRIAADYEEVLASHRRLVRELDVFLNGAGAAKQANLADIIKQLKSETQRIWIIKDSNNEPVMMCPHEPNQQYLARVREKIGDHEVHREAYLLFKQ